MITNSRRAFLMSAISLPTGLLLPKAVSADDLKDRFDWTLHEPEKVGMSRDGLNKVHDLIQKYIDGKVIAGAVTAVARHNKLVWFEAQGVRDAPTGAKLRKDDFFRMMSSTKPVVAVAVLILMDCGKLTLDDPVSRFIPEFKGQKVAVAEKGAKDAKGVKFVPAERDITIKDLLTHTSGLSSGGDGALSWAPKTVPADSLNFTLSQLGVEHEEEAFLGRADSRDPSGGGNRWQDH